MKIWCDVCDKEEASVFCSADEAALCDGCDRRVHHANKLAGKHLRFSLLHPTHKEFPLCDICQERRAFLFCQEDRAILCRECDLPIHKANEHTQKHNRFLLTGVKLSASSSSYPVSSPSNGGAETTNPISSMNRPSSISPEAFSSTSTGKTLPPTNQRIDDIYTSDTASISASSFSEYLMETLPGWRVEDFLEPSSTTSNGLFLTPYHRVPDQVPSEDLAIWVPKVPPQIHFYVPENAKFDGFEGFMESKGLKNNKRERRDDCFAVRQISPPSIKKSRHFW
ncbi:hypothetical protein SLE2022_200850 [Rubroshorea leprosula]